MKEIKNAAERIDHLANIIPPLLLNIPESDFAHKPSPQKWSKKQIIGHLIDSAANNHHRFIRSRLENNPDIFYNQDHWNDLTRYNEINSHDLIHLWANYNKLLAHIILHVASEDLHKKCRSGKNEHTLAFIITDYVDHLEHHLRQVVHYD